MTDASGPPDASRPSGDRAWASAGPGEVRPAATRRLDRPPGERFAPPPSPPPMAGPHHGRAVLGGAAGGAAAAVLWVVIGGILDLSAGLIVVAIVAGWLVGGGTALGAWGRRPHPSDRVPWLAGILGLLTWLAGSVLLYLYAEVTLPDSSLTLADRLASTPLTDWLAPQFLPLGPLELLLLAGVSWWSAR